MIEERLLIEERLCIYDFSGGRFYWDESGKVIEEPILWKDEYIEELTSILEKEYSEKRLKHRLRLIACPSVAFIIIWMGLSHDQFDGALFGLVVSALLIGWILGVWLAMVLLEFAGSIFEGAQFASGKEDAKSRIGSLFMEYKEAHSNWKKKFERAQDKARQCQLTISNAAATLGLPTTFTNLEFDLSFEKFQQEYQNRTGRFSGDRSEAQWQMVLNAFQLLNGSMMEFPDADRFVIKNEGLITYKLI